MPKKNHSTVNSTPKAKSKPGYVVNIPMVVRDNSDSETSSQSSSEFELSYSESELKNPPYSIDTKKRGMVENEDYYPEDCKRDNANVSRQPLQRIATLFEEQSFGKNPIESKQNVHDRLAVNIGLNRMKSISKDHNRALQRALLENVKASFSFKRFAFFWLPKWKKTNPNNNKVESVTLKEVRHFYKKLKKKYPKRAREFIKKNEDTIKKAEHAAAPIERMVPFREIREKIKNNQNTAYLVKTLRKNLPDSQIFLTINDADVQRLRTQQQGVFSVYDEKIKEHYEAQQNAHVLTTGYSVSKNFPLIALSVEIDFAVRDAISKQFKNAPYYPEPNLVLLIEADKNTVIESFNPPNKPRDYAIPQESVNIINNILKARQLDPARCMVFDINNPIETKPPRRFFYANKRSKKQRRYVGTYTENQKIVCWTKQDLIHYVNISQSHVKVKAWFDNIVRVLPINERNITIAGTEYSLGKADVTHFVKSILATLYRSFNPIEIAEYREAQKESISHQDSTHFIAQLSYVVNHYHECTGYIIQNKTNMPKNNFNEIWEYIEKISSMEKIQHLLKKLLNDSELANKLIAVAKDSGAAIKKVLEENLCLNYIELTQENFQRYFQDLHFKHDGPQLRMVLKNNIPKFVSELLPNVINKSILLALKDLEGNKVEDDYATAVYKGAYILLKEAWMKHFLEKLIDHYLLAREQYSTKFSSQGSDFALDVDVFANYAAAVLIVRLSTYMSKQLMNDEKYRRSSIKDEFYFIFFDTQFLRYFDFSDLDASQCNFVFKHLVAPPSKLNPLNLLILENTLLEKNVTFCSAAKPLLTQKKYDIYHTTPLHWAAFCGNKAIIKALLDTNNSWLKALNQAATHGVLPLHCGLQFCVLYGNDPELITLLCNEQNVNTKTIDGKTPLLIALTELEDPISIVKVLCEKGALSEPTYKDLLQLLNQASPEELSTPVLACLHYCENPYDLVAALIEVHGADPHQRGMIWKEIPLQDEECVETWPICEAIRANDEATVDLFIKHKVQLTDIYDDDGQPPLFLAKNFSTFKMIKKLVTAGADVNEVEKSEENCLLHEAISPLYNGDYDKKLLTYLVELEGIDLEIEDGANKTPLQVAIEANNRSAIKILRNAGADTDNVDKFEKQKMRNILSKTHSDDENNTSQSPSLFFQNKKRKRDPHDEPVSEAKRKKCAYTMKQPEILAPGTSIGVSPSK